MILTGRTSTLCCKQSVGHYHKRTCLQFKIWLAFWLIMLVPGYTVLGITSYSSYSSILQFHVTLWLQSPGYCLPVLQSPEHYNFMSLSGYRVLDIAFLCFRVLDITILCHSVATESWILPSSASKSWTLHFYANIWLPSHGYLQLHFRPCFLCTVSKLVLTTVRIQAKVLSWQFQQSCKAKRRIPSWFWNLSRTLHGYEWHFMFR
jgi:hypothetical protein